MKKIFSIILIIAVLLTSFSMITVAGAPLTLKMLTNEDFAQPAEGKLIIQLEAGKKYMLSSDIDLSALTCEVNINTVAGSVFDGNNKSIYNAKNFFINTSGGTIQNVSFGTEENPMELSFGFVLDAADTTTVWENVDMYFYNRDRTVAADSGGFARFVLGSHIFRNCEMHLDWEKTVGAKNLSGWIGYADHQNVELVWDSCATYGTVRDGGGSYVGGFLASCNSAKSVTLKNCVNYANIIAGATDRYAVGFAPFDDDTEVTIENCINYGNITAINQTASSVGGITTNCGVGTVKDCVNYGSLIGSSYVGGIVGEVNSDATVVGCENYGEINGTSAASGIVGFNRGNVTVDKCLALGDINSKGNSGSIVGANGETGTVKITDTYAFANASAALVGKGTLSGESSGNITLSTYTDVQGANAKAVSEAVALLNENDFTLNGRRISETVKADSMGVKVIMQREAHIESICLDKTTVGMILHGDEVTLIAMVFPGYAIDKEIVWSSSDESIVKVDNGALTAVAKGTAIITATSVAASEIKATCTVNVNDPVSDVINKINKIPDPVTLACKKEIVAAEQAYNALSEELQELVTNRQVLFDARATYNALVEEQRNRGKDDDDTAPSSNEAKADDEVTAKEKGGCGSAVLGGIAVIMAVTVGSCLVLKKKDD